MAHVFIVNEKSLKVHLKYLFAGTGAKDSEGKFLADTSVDITGGQERNLVSMIADISRIRENDKIIFYLQKSKDKEGRFFGSFKAASRAFLCTDSYLDNELGKKLIFRILLKPDEVYPKGVTERNCLDNLEGINKPYELCWSLIYRKLRANRGCTMITDYEYEYIMKKIRKENDQKLPNDKSLTYDSEKNQICCIDETDEYEGKKESLDITERLLYKIDNKNAYEKHLQAYIMQNIEKIKELHINNKPIKWLGNEMSCGVGMQSIDVIFMQGDKKDIHIVVCELKCEQPEIYIKDQISKYVDWVKQYLLPVLKCENVIIDTFIVAPTPNGKTRENLKRIDLGNTKYIAVSRTEEGIAFNMEEIS